MQIVSKASWYSKRKMSWCYIIEEGFFILSCFVDYILSFSLVRLRTIRLSGRVGAYIECSSRSCAGDMTITNVIIKTPDRKWDWGVNDVISGSNELGILVIFEKAVNWDSDLGVASRVVVYGMRRAFVGSVSWESDSGLRVQLGIDWRAM